MTKERSKEAVRPRLTRSDLLLAGWHGIYTKGRQFYAHPEHPNLVVFKQAVKIERARRAIEKTGRINSMDKHTNYLILELCGIGISRFTQPDGQVWLAMDEVIKAICDHARQIEEAAKVGEGQTGGCRMAFEKFHWPTMFHDREMMKRMRGQEPYSSHYKEWRTAWQLALASAPEQKPIAQTADKPGDDECGDVQPDQFQQKLAQIEKSVAGRPDWMKQTATRPMHEGSDTLVAAVEAGREVTQQSIGMSFEQWYGENVSGHFVDEHRGMYHHAHAVFGEDVKAAWDYAMSTKRESVTLPAPDSKATCSTRVQPDTKLNLSSEPDDEAAIVERMAKALFNTDSSSIILTWDQMDEDQRGTFKKYAQAAYAASGAREWRERAKRAESAIQEVVDCFGAAYAEGLTEKLVEAQPAEPGDLADLVIRRLEWASHAALNVFAALPKPRAEEMGNGD